MPHFPSELPDFSKATLISLPVSCLSILRPFGLLRVNPYCPAHVKHVRYILLPLLQQTSTSQPGISKQLWLLSFSSASALLAALINWLLLLDLLALQLLSSSKCSYLYCPSYFIHLPHIWVCLSPPSFLFQSTFAIAVLIYFCNPCILCAMKNIRLCKSAWEILLLTHLPSTFSQYLHFLFYFFVLPSFPYI